MEYLLDRENKLKHWGAGEWLDEPDRLQFEHAGFDCEMIRAGCADGVYLFGGHWCGYVKLPSEDFMTEDEIHDLDVHGDITFNQMKNDGYYIGFDCAHCDDIIPSMKEFSIGDPLSSYKNLEYVRNEVKSLAEQVAEKMEPE